MQSESQPYAGATADSRVSPAALGDRGSTGHLASASLSSNDEPISSTILTDSKVSQLQMSPGQVETAQDAEPVLSQVEAAQTNVELVLNRALQGGNAQQLKTAIHLAVRCLAYADSTSGDFSKVGPSPVAERFNVC